VSASRFRLGLGVGAVALALVLAVAPAALAADSNPATFVQIRAIDALNAAAPTVGYFDAGSGQGAPPKITANGVSVKVGTPTPEPPSTPRGIAVVFDTSTAAESSGALVAAKAALTSWVQGRTGAQVTAEQFAIYAANDKGVLVQDFTNDTAKLVAAINQVAPPPSEAARKQTALWSAVRQAAGGLNDNSNLEPELVIMAAQNDNASKDQEKAAVGEVASANTPVFSLAYTGAGYDPSALQSLSSSYGGELLTSAQGPGIGDLMTKTQSIVDTSQYTVTYASSAKSGQVVNLTLAASGQTTSAYYSAGTATVGYDNLTQTANGASKGGVSLLQGSLGLILAVLLVLVAVAMGAYAIILVVTRDNSLNNVLQPYSEGYGPQDEVEEGEASYAKTAIIQRAVEVTEQFADSQGYLSRAENALERANLPLRAGEALFFYAALVVVATILGFALSSFFVGLIFGLFAALVPMATVSFIAGRRRKKFLSLLPDTLQLLSGTLRAGYSLMQGVEAISQEVEDPMGQELRRVVTEARLGRPLEEALEGVAERMDSPDFSWTVMAIRIQREVGGNLSELLLTVADTMTQRERLRRDVAALTAEGKISAIVLACLPVGLGVLMYLINPAYMSKLFTDTLGNVMLGLAIVGMLVGFLWMRSIINIEI
jgi:tight adherence protein B